MSNDFECIIPEPQGTTVLHSQTVLVEIEAPTGRVRVIPWERLDPHIKALGLTREELVELINEVFNPTEK